MGDSVMQYFVFDSRAQAQAAADAIYARAVELYTPLNRLDEDKQLIGVNALTLVLNDDAQKTSVWAEPRYRLDGKWCLLHPAMLESNLRQLQNTSRTIAEYVTQDVIAPTDVDPEDGSWFASALGHH